ncbi:MAG: class I SAM-dependent methyltransferase [Anaerolineae bacterium]
MDVLSHNANVWDRRVAHGDIWTIPVGPEVVAAARRGVVELLLTPSRFVPAEWYPSLPGADVLCLASGGGQQGPVLAAAGAHVTVLDASPAQLARDREVAAREHLDITTVQGDMADLSAFCDGSFDLIFHPVSNCYAPAVRPVWHECARVLRSGGALLAGFNNPVTYIFDQDALWERGEMVVRHSLPYSDLQSMPPEALERWLAEGNALEFSHTLEDLIGGQCDAGLLIAGMYEDRWTDPGAPALDAYSPWFIATRAIKR